MKLQILLLILLFTCETLEAQHKDKKKPEVPPSFLGVDINESAWETDGAYIVGLYKGYNAEKAGLGINDIIIAVNSDPIHNYDDLVKVLEKYKAGETIELSIVRKNNSLKIATALSAYPDFLKYNRFPPFDVKKSKAQLGITVESDWEQYAVLVTGFTKKSAAQQSGLKLGDLIYKIDNYELATLEELRYHLSRYKPDDVVTITVKRDGEIKSLRITLGEER